MATTSTIDDLRKFYTQIQRTPGAAPGTSAMKPFPVPKQTAAAKPQPAPRTKTSVTDVQKFFGRIQAPRPSPAQRALEALPGGRAVEQYAGRQAERWTGVAKNLQAEREELFGKPGHRGEVQRAWQSFVNDPAVKPVWERLNTPLNQDPSEYKRYLNKREWEDREFAKTHGQLAQAGRGLMESIHDTAAGLTAPANALLIAGTEGGGAEVREGLKAAGETAEAEAGLKAVQSGETETGALAIAKAARKTAETAFNESAAAATSLREFTAKKAASSLLALGFSAQMLSSIKPQLAQAEAQFKTGDMTGGIRSGTDAIFSLVFGLGGIVHAGEAGLETRRQWKNEAEVRSALQAGAQESYKKPWAMLTPNEKTKVVYDAVNQYGPEEAKKFHRTIQALEPPPPALTAELDHYLDQGIADRDATERASEGLMAALPAETKLPIPSLRRPGEAVVEMRRREMAALPAPEKTGRSQAMILEFPRQPMTPAERQAAWYEQRKTEALRELEDERAREAVQPAPEEAEAELVTGIPHVERRSVTDYAALEAEIRRATPQAPELRSKAEHLYEVQSDELRRMGAELEPGARNVEPSIVYERLRRRRFEGEALSETEDRFISQYARRKQTEKLLIDPRTREAASRLMEQVDRAQVEKIMGLATREGKIFGAAFDLQKEAMRARSADEAAFYGEQSVDALSAAAKLQAQREAEQAARRAALDPNQFVPRGTEVYVHQGTPTEISLPDGRKLQARYGAVRLSRLIPSHDPHSFEWNENYKPRLMQPRNLKTNLEAQSAIIVDSQEGHFETRRFASDNPTPEQGPPIILKDGRVAGGNSRMMRLQRALETGDRQTIIQDLNREMGKFGIKVTDDFAETDDPLIPVRVLEDFPEDVAELARYGQDFNRDFIMAFTPDEQAVMDGQRLSLEDVEQVSRWIEALPGEGEAQSLNKLLNTRGQEIFDLMVRTGVIEENKRAAYLRLDSATRTAQLTEDAKTAFKRMILGKVIDDANLLALSKDAVLNKIERAMVPLVRIKSAAPEWNITDYLKRSLQLWIEIERVRDELDVVGKKSDPLVDKYLHPENFVDSHGFHGAARMIAIDEPHPISRALAKLLDLSGLKVKDALWAYADEAEQRQISLAAPMNPVEAFNRFVGEQVDVEVSPLDWGTLSAASEAAKETFKEDTEHPPKATEEQKRAEETPREMNPIPAMNAAAERITSAAIDGTVTPESLRALFAADPRFQRWSEPLMKIFGKILPNATGMNLADFLRKALADVWIGEEATATGGPVTLAQEAVFSNVTSGAVRGQIAYSISAADGTPVGKLRVEEIAPGRVEIKGSSVRIQGEGYGGRLYQEVIQAENAKGNTVVSDQHGVTSPEAARVWESLVRRGIAEKVGDTYQAPALRESLFQAKKGAISLAADGRRIIQLFENADVSTVIHEFFHAMRPYLNADDLKVLEDYAHSELRKQGVTAGTGIWTAEKEELLARTWERYLSKGEAPTPEMKGIFERMRDAFRKIYYLVSGNSARLPAESPINVRIPKNVKATFDSWFGKEFKEEEIKAPPEAGTQIAAPPESIETDITPEEREHLKPAFFGPKHYHEVEGAPRVKRADTLAEIRAWAVLNKQNLKGMTAWTTPEGKAVAMYVPVEAGTLFQEEPSLFEMSDRLRRLRNYREAQAAPNPALDQEIAQLQARIDKRVGAPSGAILPLTPPPSATMGLSRPPQLRPEVRPSEFVSLFPEQSDAAAAYRPRTKPDDTVGLQNAGGYGGLAEPAGRPGGPAKDSPSLPGRRAGVGGGRPAIRGVVELADVRPIQLAPATKPVSTPLVDPAQWKYRMAELRMPQNAPAPTARLDDDIAAVLIYPGQREVGESAYSALQQFDGTIIATPAGTGKTWTSLSVARQFWNDGQRRQLIVTKNRRTINQKNGWKGVGKNYFNMKIEDLPGSAREIKPETAYVTTYAQLIRNPWLAQLPWDLTLFDESGEARRWYESKQGDLTKALSDASKKAVYISATPFHTALEYGYMTKMGLWEPGQFESWARQFDALRDSRSGKWVRHGINPKKLLKLREQIIARGQFITQDKSYEGYTSHFAMAPLTQQNRVDLVNARRAFTEAENYFNERGDIQRARAVRRVAVTWTKNYLERARLKPVAEIMRQARKQGWQVVVFSENNQERNEVYTFMREADEAMGGRLNALLPNFAGVYDTLARELGAENVANFSGRESPARTGEMEAFLSGEKPFMYASFGAGGVGVSMHDDSEGGIRPRMAIYLGPSYSGIMFEQAQGRLWRFGTNSNVHQIFMTSDARPEVDMMLTKIVPRLESLKAAVNGIDGTDPIIERMKLLESNHTDAAGFAAGAEIEYDMNDFQPVSDRVPISNWIEAQKQIPDAQQAKAKGMKYPGQVDARPGRATFEKLFQEGGEVILPARFLSPEEAKARLLNEELMQSVEEGRPVPGAGGELKDLNRGTRKIFVDTIGPTVEGKIARHGEADPVGTARVAWKTAMTEILAAKRAGEVDALTAPEGKGPAWEMRAPSEPGVPTEPPIIDSNQVRTNYYLLSGRENIKSVAKQAGVPLIGRQIVRNLQSYLAARAGYAGEWTYAYDKILRENKIDKKEHRLLWMVKEGKLPPPNQRIARAAQQTTELLNEIRRRAAERGLYIEDYDEGGRKVQIAYEDILDNPHYMPHIHDYKEKIRLKDPQSGEEQTFTLAELLGGKLSDLKKNRIMGAIQANTGKSRYEVEKFLASRKRRTPLSGNLERARTADLPFYRMDKGAMVQYFESAGELFARAEIFGQDRNKLDGLVAQIPNAKARQVTNTVMDSLLKPRRWDEDSGKMYSRMAAAEVITKMAFSSVKVPFHLVHSGLLLEQYRPVFRGMLMTALNFREMKERAVFSGAVMEQVRAELMLEQGTDLKLAHEFLSASGFNSLYKLDRIIANAAGQQWMEKYALPKLMHKAKSSAHIREQLREKLLIDDAQIDRAIAAGRWTQEDLNRGGVALTNKAMFTNDPTELPPAWRARADDPVSDKVNMALRAATILKSFTFKTAMILKEQLIDEARKGNFRPWIPFLLAYPLAGESMRFAGAAAQTIPSFNRPPGTPTPLGAYANQLEELFDDPSAAKIAQRWLDDVAHATGLTMFSHVMDVFLFPNADKRKARFQAQRIWTDELEEIAGPIYTDIWNTFHSLGDILGSATIEEGDEKFEKMGKATRGWLREEFPVLRGLVPASTASRYAMAPPP